MVLDVSSSGSQTVRPGKNKSNYSVGKRDCPYPGSNQDSAKSVHVEQKESEPGHVQRSLQELHSTLDKLEEATSMLYARLGDVLVVRPGDDRETACDTKSSAASRLEDMIQGATCKVQGQIAGAISVIESLRL